MKAGEIQKVMKAAELAIKKDVSARQLRIMNREMLNEGAEPEGIEIAFSAVSDEVEAGASPEEARKGVSDVVRQCLQEGLRGTELAAKIHERIRERKMERDAEHMDMGKGKGAKRGDEASEKKEWKRNKLNEEKGKNQQEGQEQGGQQKGK